MVKVPSPMGAGTPYACRVPPSAPNPAPLPAALADRLPALHAALGGWWAAAARPLRFRADPSPWGVLVAEVMAQQTRIDRVEAAWGAFLALFPTPAALAAAPTADVIRAWAGMGYNRRALQLQRAAAEIVARHDGVPPRTVAELQALPGVGPYTARAVAAIAWGAPVGPVDVNVARVVGRLAAAWGAEGDPGVRPRPAPLQAWADALVDPAAPAAWTHALMDLGATVCRPRLPRCASCPVAAFCARPAAAAAAPDGPPLSAAPPAARRAAVPFPATTRWLRGRILERARALPDGAWTTIETPLGLHDADAVGRAIAALAREGLIEARPDGAVRLPSRS